MLSLTKIGLVMGEKFTRISDSYFMKNIMLSLTKIGLIMGQIITKIININSYYKNPLYAPNKTLPRLGCYSSPGLKSMLPSLQVYSKDTLEGFTVSQINTTRLVAPQHPPQF